MMMPLPKKKVGAAALDESDGRRSASEAGRAPAQRPRRDRGIAAKQCRSSLPLNRLGQIRGDGELWARPGPRGHRAGARQARVLTGCQHEIRELRTYRRACVYSLKGLKMRNRSLYLSLVANILKNRVFFLRGFDLAGSVRTSNLRAHGASIAEIGRLDPGSRSIAAKAERS